MKSEFRIVSFAALLTTAALTAPARSHGDETSKADAKGDRSTMRWECVVDGSLDEVWDAFTTKKGIESWMVPVAEIDLRVGGTLKTNYDKKAGIGGPGTIVHHILSMEPKRMLSCRFDAPENAKVVKIAEKSWEITYFDAVGPKQTRVTLVACGYGEGPEWDAARAFFEKGNAYTLEKLKAKFKKTDTTAVDDKSASTKAPADAKTEPDALDMLAPLVGEWKFEKKLENGKLFCGHATYEKGPNGKSLIGHGTLGDETKQSPHAATQLFRDPASGEVRFHNLDENGGVAQGAVRVSSDNELTWDWDVTNSDGKVVRYLVKTQCTGRDEFQFFLYLRAGEPPYKELIHVTYRRVK